MNQTMRMSALFCITVSIALASSVAPAQVVYETYRPFFDSPVTVVESPVIYQSYRPIESASTFTNYHPDYAPVASYVGAPIMTYRPVADYAAPVVTYRPFTSYSPVVAYSPVVSYSPVVTSYAYRPIVTGYGYSPYVTGYAYRPVVLRPSYVPGQPVRNFFRRGRAY